MRGKDGHCRYYKNCRYYRYYRDYIHRYYRYYRDYIHRYYRDYRYYTYLGYSRKTQLNSFSSVRPRKMSPVASSVARSTVRVPYLSLSMRNWLMYRPHE